MKLTISRAILPGRKLLWRQVRPKVSQEPLTDHRQCYYTLYSPKPPARHKGSGVHVFSSFLLLGFTAKFQPLPVNLGLSNSQERHNRGYNLVGTFLFSLEVR